MISSEGDSKVANNKQPPRRGSFRIHPANKNNAMTAFHSPDRTEGSSSNQAQRLLTSIGRNVRPRSPAALPSLLVWFGAMVLMASLGGSDQIVMI